MPRFVFVLACATGIARSWIASKIKRLSHIKLYGVATASRCSGSPAAEAPRARRTWRHGHDV